MAGKLTRASLRGDHPETPVAAQGSQKKPPPHLPAKTPRTRTVTVSKEKWPYLRKQNWDDFIPKENNVETATDFATVSSNAKDNEYYSHYYKLADLSREDCAIPLDLNQFDETQLILEEADKDMAIELNVPSEDEYNTQLAELDNNAADAAKWMQFNEQQQQYVKLEADIHQYASVVELGWEPANKERPLQKFNGKLRGGYFVRVKRRDKEELETVSVVTEWVEKNFEPKGVGNSSTSVQRLLREVPSARQKWLVGVKEWIYQCGEVSNCCNSRKRSDQQAEVCCRQECACWRYVQNNQAIKEEHTKA